MLFNSFEFLLLYLPLTLTGYFWLGNRRPFAAATWLAAMSLAFYAWWDVRYLPLLLASIIFNFLAGERISYAAGRSRTHWLAISITANLLLLAYFKYADFFISSTNALLHSNFELLYVVLPIGISFFTFTQIAYLVDTWQGKVKEYRFIHYVLFVTYFPHLIAGPILHHKEMMPQFARVSTYRPNWSNFGLGTSLFVLGLTKKVLLADNFAPYVGPVFDSDQAPQLIEAWGAALAYTFQLYFDFSGYTDMALGLAKIIGVDLPINFNSPYKSKNIIEFWRRWHMTLSRFLRDYLYIPLGGNRQGVIARYRNLFVTMLLGGLWHGAGWTYVIWGALHGTYLTINHAWAAFLVRRGLANTLRQSRLYSFSAQALCFTAVVFAWVFFRATTFEQAMNISAGMLGFNGISVPSFAAESLRTMGFYVGSGTGRFIWPEQVLWLVIGFAICFFLPNSIEVIETQSENKSRTTSHLSWRYSWPWLMLLVLLSLACLYNLNSVSEFLYFQF